jgi:hypothetical protein
VSVADWCTAVEDKGTQEPKVSASADMSIAVSVADWCTAVEDKGTQEPVQKEKDKVVNIIPFPLGRLPRVGVTSTLSIACVGNCLNV